MKGEFESVSERMRALLFLVDRRFSAVYRGEIQMNVLEVRTSANASFIH
jgi:hypothetical protein